jgi:Na+/proline symporter
MGDFLQGIVAVFAIVLVSLVGVAAAGGPMEVTSRIVELGQEWRLDPLAFTGWTGGEFPALWWLTMLVIAVLGGFGMGTSIDWYVEAQRIQSSRSVRDASYGLWAGGLVTLIRNAFWAAAILAFFVLLPGLSDLAEYELGWFRLGFELLPAGLVGVFFGALLAIHLSTISSHLNLGALYFTRDLYQRYLRPGAGERRLVWVGRAATLVLLVGSFFYGLMMEEITRWLIFALWLMMAGIWLPNILQVVWWRFNAWGYLTSWIANLGVSWLVVWILPAFGVLPSLPNHAQFWLLMALGAAVFLPATFFTRPEPMDHMVRYYVMTRPLGWWKPVHAEAVRRGLIADEPRPERTGRRPLIRREWTAAEAQDWSREDWIAIVLSPLVYGCVLFGLVRLLLWQLSGLWLLAVAVLGSLAIYWVIDPKLRAVSIEYELKQGEYAAELDRRMRWENDG